MIKSLGFIFLLFSNFAFAKETIRFEVQVDRKPIVEFSDVRSVNVDQSGSDWDLIFHLTNSATTKIAGATKKNIGKIMDIIINDQIRSSPMIRSELKTGKITVSADLKEQEAKNIANEFTRLLKIK